MVARTYPRSPERVAWTVLLGSFVVFVTLAVTLVVGGRWILRHSQVPETINMAASGTVLVTRPNRPVPEVNLADIPIGSQIKTEANAQASLTFTAPDGPQVLATIRIFGGTIVQLDQASSPQYFTGSDPHTIRLHVTGGRVRATVGLDVPRQVRIVIESDPGAVTVLDTPGSNATIQADPTETMVTVREGKATVTAQGASVPLTKDQRAGVNPQSPPQGPLPAEQNLIKNGDFADPLGGVWVQSAPLVADPAEKPGNATITTIGGRRTVQLDREGNNWAHVGVTEQINRDVQGLTSLRLNLDIFIAAQDIRNCGQSGTECPLMVKISYVDVGGGNQEWLQGFYFFYDPNPAFGLTYCGTCPVQYRHIQWPFAKWQTFSSDDLLQVFAANGTTAAFIKSISIYGEGHSFNSLFTDVQLLANE